MSSNLPNDLYSIFTKSNVILLLWFLAIYVVLSFILKIIYMGGDVSRITSRTYDIIIFLFVVILIVANYQNLTLNNQLTFLENTTSNISSYIDYPYSVFSTLIFIFVFYTLTFIFGIPMSFENKSIFISITETVAWIILFLSIVNWFFIQVFGLSIIDTISKWINDFWNGLYTSYSDIRGKQLGVSSTVSINGNEAVMGGNTTVKNEVFNISNNLYDYEEAQAICKAYGARLATYNDIEKSYEDGGEWCNYGWSEGQMIYFPTQKETWQQLQSNENTKNNCGRPGINGGYMENPYLQFGVNCYGVKPPETDADKLEMEARKNQIYASSPNEEELDNKVEYWKKNATKLLNVNSFNNNKWSEY